MGVYKLRLGRTYNLGNYESERIELERDFPDETATIDAYYELQVEVAAIHNESNAAKVKK